MSEDRPGKRLRAVRIPSAADAREQAVAEARAEVASRGEPARSGRSGRHRALAYAAAALLAVVLLLTPPGRAASAWVGELVGIGEVGGEPTQRYRTFGVDDTAVVIDNGRAPDGSRYEWVAYDCKVDLRDEGSPGVFTGIGLSFEWPGVAGHEGTGGCEELKGRPRPPDDAIGGSVHILPSEFKGVGEPDLVVSGQTGAGIHDVKVFYREPDGTRHELDVDFARVDGELAELAHRPEPLGTFVAFVPGEWAARDEVESRLDLRALQGTGTLHLGPIGRRERELAIVAREECDDLQPSPADLPSDADMATVEEAMEPFRKCWDRHMPPSPFEYVAYDDEGREINRFEEPLVTAMYLRAGDVEPAGHEKAGDERQRWEDVSRGRRPEVVMSGRAPDGALYEVVVSRHGSDMTCTTMWWPYVKHVLTGGDCGGFPPETAYGRREPAKIAARPWGFLANVPQVSAHSMLSGYAREAVSRVRVVYRGRDGERHDAPLKLARVRGAILERLDADEPFGFWVAFLPRSAGGNPMVEVIAYDESGRVVSRIDYRA
jgi:hypothetical protein